MSLAVSNLSKRYGKHAVLSDLTHAFAPGLTLVTGRSGAGKSTLLRLLASLERPSGGSILWNGNPLPRTPRAYRAQLGYVPQAIDYPETLTAMEFLLHIGALKGLATAPCRDQTAQLLSRVGLGADGGRRIATYSGGMRRRLSLVQGLLGDPRTVILDEPTAELDAQTQADVHALLDEVSARAQVIMTTHRDAGFPLPHDLLHIANAAE